MIPVKKIVRQTVVTDLTTPSPVITYNEIKDEFPCEYRRKIEVQNRGLLKMYFLS